MKTHEWKQLLSAYHDQECNPQEKALAEDFLAKDPAGRAYLKELGQLSIDLQRCKDEDLSPDVEIKMKSFIHKETSMVVKNWKLAATLASTLLVLVLALNVFQRSSQRTFRDKSISFDIGGTTQYEPYYIAESQAPAPSTPVSRRAGREYETSMDYAEPDSLKIADDRSMLAQAPEKKDILSNELKKEYVPIESFADFQIQGLIETSVTPPADPFNTEEYTRINDNQFMTVVQNPLSTVSTDVDTASYSNMRRYLVNQQMPPKDAVRIEEMVNYFSYDYPRPAASEPFSVTTDLAICPWNTKHQILRIGLKGRTPDDAAQLPASNLVFLIDVSGSMSNADKLPLLKEGFKILTRNLRPKDQVAIVVYAGNAGVVLPSTSGVDKDTIIAALERLQSGGSTAGGEGIRLAYKIAKEHFIKEGNNRVILATDGDFNVGVSSTAELERLIEWSRKDNIFLTVLGFGTGNYKDGRMEVLADKGNGNYYYIDTVKEAKKVLSQELGSTLFTIAKDVKLQIEFNPRLVSAYRLIGYENRMLTKEDFNNDQKDAGEIGAGHTVTVLYELVPTGSEEGMPQVDALKYQQPAVPVAKNDSEMLTLKLRYKEPDQDTSKLITKSVLTTNLKEVPTGDFAWASAVAEFGMVLRQTEFKGTSSLKHVLETAQKNIGTDNDGYRAEFIDLVQRAESLIPEGEGQIKFK